MYYKTGLQAWCKRKIWMQRNLKPPLQSHFQKETQPPTTTSLQDLWLSQNCLVAKCDTLF